MGQRLNLEIWNNGKVLANAYYHWSAYTDSSAAIVNTAINYIKNNPLQNDNDLLYAIRILEATGAGLTTEEIEHAKLRPSLEGATFAECNGRNTGLIGISNEAIRSTRDWQEYSVFVFLDEKRISFRVIFTQRAWQWEREQRVDYGNAKADARELEIADFNFDDIKFDAWDELNEFLQSREECFVCSIDRFNVITPIR